MFRSVSAILVFIVLASISAIAYGQDAQIQGQILDTGGAAIARAAIYISDQQTGTGRKVESDGSGHYIVPGLSPGQYKIIVEANGFSTAVSNVITLNVLQNAVFDFKLKIGAASSEVVVNADNLNINTIDGSVSTVVDRQFVENLPLNGRSFQSLIYLTPGVAANASASNNEFSAGQFVVNGQRGDANYWMVDGVSANIGVNVGLVGAGSAGALGGSDINGGTNALVSVDALQEFRIETSTYAPEFGRAPGGQISIQTRSGTNQFHGMVFDYFRNTDLDAEDWFADHYGLPKSAEHQNDFGGVLGGPILRDKSFFFLSLEGLRLLLPETEVSTVPDPITAVAHAIPAMQPYIQSYPKPKPGWVDFPCVPNMPCTPDLAPYSATFSNPSTSNAYSLRVDHQLFPNLSLFARYNHAPSQTTSRGGGAVPANDVFDEFDVTKTATIGGTWTKSSRVVNDVRFNYSVSGGAVNTYADTFGGGTPLPGENLLPSPLSFRNANMILNPTFGTGMDIFSGFFDQSYQRQYNIVDTLSVQKGAHNLKLGADYRRLMPNFHYGNQIIPFFSDVQGLEGGISSFTLVANYAAVRFLMQNLGVFAQDAWRVTPRLNLTYGLRWDVDFLPETESGSPLPAISGFSLTNLDNVALAPAGTPAYRTQYGNLAPRIGGAYQLSTNPEWGRVVRSGFGVFYSLASTEAMNHNIYFGDYPFGNLKTLNNAPFPTTPHDAMMPPIIPPDALQGELFGFDPHLKLPYALEWNFALEQSMGKAQSLTLSYIGASNKRMLQSEAITAPNTNYASVVLVGNTGSSNYQAFQAQFQRRLTNGLQVLASYTFSHSIDTGSYGAYASGTFADMSANRGDSDNDVRHVFSAAFTYSVPEWRSNAISRAVTGGWSTDDIVQIRGGVPVDVTDGNFAQHQTSGSPSIVIRPDVVPGQPKYLAGSQYPGGKAINPALFTDPPVDPATGYPTRQGDLHRNALRALGQAQWDFAVHREFPIFESLRLQFRAELFNILNHPNFAPFNSTFQIGNQYFGQSTRMLNQYLGTSQNPLYTPGGPRSGQLALKLVF